MTSDSQASHPSTVPLWRNVRVLSAVAQLVFAALVLLVGYWLYGNMMRGLARQGTALSFEFLRGNASFALAESPIPYDPANSYAYAFLVGVLNTLRVVIVGIILASLLGLVGGITRLSSNWLLAKIAQGYVELIRNTPLLIQLFFWYFVGAIKLPRVRESLQLPGSIFLSNRGLALPWLTPNPTLGTWLEYAVSGLIIAVVVYWLLGRAARVRLPRLARWRGLAALLLFLGVAVGNALILTPFTPTIPRMQGFNFAGGTTLSPEYVSLLVGLVVYTGAFITEIVRAGLQAVPRGLNEASRALGLNYFQTLRLVTIPLALRVIIPPLTNQYLNLAKNSSLAIAVGYADVFYVGQTIFNQSGQTIQVIFMIMAAYLSMSLIISGIMNQINSRFRLVER
jgi:general L-amino acid transport system permease protein